MPRFDRPRTRVPRACAANFRTSTKRSNKTASICERQPLCERRVKLSLTQYVQKVRVGCIFFGEGFSPSALAAEVPLGLRCGARPRERQLRARVGHAPHGRAVCGGSSLFGWDRSINRTRVSLPRNRGEAVVVRLEWTGHSVSDEPVGLPGARVGCDSQGRPQPYLVLLRPASGNCNDTE